jgi:hypothetical protein
MKTHQFTTLSMATNALIKEGYKEDFIAQKNGVKATYAEKTYSPEELKIIKSYRFEGASNPQDSTALLVIEANDGLKGTLILSYAAEHNHNADMIRRIPTEKH